MTKKLLGSKMVDGATVLLAVVFGLVVFHAPLSVFFGQFAPPLLVKSWKEIIMLIVLLPLMFGAWQAGKLRYFNRNLLLCLILLYALLHIVLLGFFASSATQKLAGLAIDLRYELFFGLVLAALTLRPLARRLFLKVGAAAAVLSMAFALLQVFVLPRDILKYIGYSKHTIEPYLTVDSNKAFIRINGTLRGPNPLGAYAMMLLTLLAALLARVKAVFAKHTVTFIIAIAALLIVLWASYSRSALLGAGLSVGIIVCVRFGRKLSRQQLFGVGAVALVLVAIIFAARNSYLVQNVIVHSNPGHHESVDSNQGHASSLLSSFNQMLHQPLGAGIGSTGSASLIGNQPLVIENQYLFIAHEAGWLGLVIFLMIFGVVLTQLYKKRHDWLALGVFASGIGLAVIGLVQPVFVDDTISLVWWGLAAIALAAPALKKAKYSA